MIIFSSLGITQKAHMPKLHIYKNEKETCEAFAEWLAETITECLTKNDKCTIAIAEGDIPKILFRILASKYAEKIDWSKVHLFEGDRRSVSNVINNSPLKEFIDQVPTPKEQIHTIPTNLFDEEAVQKYEDLLGIYFSTESTFDLAILSMGEDGSFLSLSPRDDENNQSSSRVIAVQNKEDNSHSITLSAPAINAAKVKALLVTGKRKENAVQQVLKGKYDPEKYPAQLIQTANKTVHWFFDEAAAAKLIRPTP